MPELKTYDLFLSHAWKYNDEYYRLEKLLHDAPLFKWRNYSVPIHDPVINPNTPSGKAKLTGLLDSQVRPANCVLIIAGIYVSYSDWILKEIKLARDYGKPIIGIQPWGSTNLPKAVKDAAITVVGWSTSSIVGAVREFSI